MGVEADTTSEGGGPGEVLDLGEIIGNCSMRNKLRSLPSIIYMKKD